MKSPELAYWIGVVQTDGYFRTFKVKEVKRSKSYLKSEIRLEVCDKSLPMLLKFREITNTLFNRDTNYHYKRGYFCYNVSVRRLLEFFKNIDITFSDPPRPPKWIISDINLFGAYLAAVIDGDGNIEIKNNKNQTAQCLVRIYSGKKQTELKKSIEKNLCCGSSIRKCMSKTGSCFELQFYISKRTNLDIFKKHVLPHIAIIHKRNKVLKKIEIEGSSSSLDKT